MGLAMASLAAIRPLSVWENLLLSSRGCWFGFEAFSFAKPCQEAQTRLPVLMAGPQTKRRFHTCTVLLPDRNLGASEAETLLSAFLVGY